jgi:hypothetical protein
VLFAGAEMKTPNHALELTAAPTVTTSSMATVSSPHLTLALGGLWVSFFCQEIGTPDLFHRIGNR